MTKEVIQEAQVVNLFMVYQFLKRLATPFSQWPAFAEGVIDERGNILIPIKKRNTVRQRNAFGKFDLLVLKLKKLLEKVPGGKSRLASYAAALYLINLIMRRLLKMIIEWIKSLLGFSKKSPTAQEAETSPASGSTAKTTSKSPKRKPRNTKTQTKRKPRGKSSASKSSSASGKKQQTQKRGRGRPRKNAAK